MNDKATAVLAALAASNGDPYSPVQLQKFLFLVDRKLGKRVGGPFFDFKPYAYGPFDASVYAVAENLERQQFVVIDYDPHTPTRKYLLTAKGRTQGEQALARFGASMRDYLVELSLWVRSQSFDSLVTAIYKQFPDMKVNSVFRG